MKKSKLWIAMLCVLLAIASLTGLALADEAPQAEAEVLEEQFAQWNEGAPALEALTEYVEAVTDTESGDYIPEADRIAVFDMDGTLIGGL